MKPEDLARLRTLAEGANRRGEWWVRDGTIMSSVGIQVDLRRGDDWLTFYSEPDAVFVAALSPPVVLALLTEIERLRGALGEIKAVGVYYDGHGYECPHCEEVEEIVGRALTKGVE